MKNSVRKRILQHSVEIDAAYANVGKAMASFADPALAETRRMLDVGDYRNAGAALERLIADDANSPVLFTLRAECSARQERFAEAARWFERALEQTPGFIAALHGLAYCYFNQSRLAEADDLLDRLLTLDPFSMPGRLLKAAVCALRGDNADAAQIYRGVIAERPDHLPSHVRLGHSLRTLGQSEQAIAAYREAIRIGPTSCEPWAALASLKTYRFSDQELATMQQLDRTPNLPASERLQLNFALGQALWQRGDDASSYHHYARAKQLVKQQEGDGQARSARRMASWVEGSIAAFSAVADPSEHRTDGPIPIFVVGLPRSGTTLVEQILGAHPLVEAAGELPYLPSIAERLVDSGARLGDVDKAAIAQKYCSAIGAHRKTDRPYLVDKLPTNYRNIALIHATMPYAKIVDVRRHPLASCVALLRQHFLNLPEFSGSLADLAWARRDYVKAMELFGAALPGAVFHLRYEMLVTETDTEIRRMLAGLGLPFDEACLNWHSSGAPVRTPSSEQVRQPIYTKAIDEWRRFDPWLDEAREILADELRDWPEPALAKLT